jgi:CheY-like chemotaxis protein
MHCVGPSAVQHCCGGIVLHLQGLGNSSSSEGTRKAGGAPELLKGVRVLVVEDEAVVAIDLVAMLEDMGAEVGGTAASGVQALRKARALRPQLAVVDIRLKDGETGIEAARVMAEEMGVAIIFASAHTDAMLAAQMSALPEAARLTKPYTVTQLADAARRVLQRQ